MQHVPLFYSGKWIAAMLIWFIATPHLAAGAATETRIQALDAVSLSIDTEATYTYTPSADDDTSFEHRLALFRSRREAAALAADYFAKRRLIQFADRNKTMLVLLVADELTEKGRERCRRTNEDQITCTIRLHSVVRLSDFIDAQLASLRLAREEFHADFREKMEPAVSTLQKPGHLLAKALQLIDQGETRMAILYVDNLTHLYPKWRELHDVKSMAVHLQNRRATSTATPRHENKNE
jgi:hypothetical protein